MEIFAWEGSGPDARLLGNPDIHKKRGTNKLHRCGFSAKLGENPKLQAFWQK